MTTTELTVPKGTTLEGLALEINEEENLQGSAMLRHVYDQGHRLAMAKQLGQEAGKVWNKDKGRHDSTFRWGSWVQENLSINKRQADRYIFVYANFDALLEELGSPKTGTEYPKLGVTNAISILKKAESRAKEAEVAEKQTATRAVVEEAAAKYDPSAVLDKLFEVEEEAGLQQPPVIDAEFEEIEPTVDEEPDLTVGDATPSVRPDDHRTVMITDQRPADLDDYPAAIVNKTRFLMRDVYNAIDNGEITYEGWQQLAATLLSEWSPNGE